MLMTTGDRYSEEQVDELLREAPIDANGDFDYIEVDQAPIFQFF
jgi:Ca2+-binding EF-hand superfamily protein